MQAEILKQTYTDAEELFLQQLREVTGPMHKKLEANPSSAALMRPAVNKQQYLNYLLVMKDVMTYCENQVFPLLQHLITDLENRKKLPSLNKDLAYLGNNNSVPAKPYNPFGAIPTIAQALGFMYVTEGSTLGGRYILKHVNALLGVDEKHGAAFFAGYGNETGKNWKSFLKILTAYAVTENCEKEIIEGAFTGFASIDAHFA